MQTLTKWDPFKDWDPFRDLSEFQHRLGSFFGHLRSKSGSDGITSSPWIPAVDIIDMSYKHWHKLSDIPEQCSADQMAEVAKVLTAWMQRVK